MEEELHSDIIKATQLTLGKYVKRPPLTDKLLKKPPFRFLHDIISSVLKSTGFFNGLFEEEELISDNVKDRESKILFLNKIISVISTTTGKKLSVKPSKIIAGQEPEKTNELLQCLALALENNLSSDEAVKIYKESVKLNAPNKNKVKEIAKALTKTAEVKKISSKSSEKSIKSDKSSSNLQKQKPKENTLKKESPPKKSSQPLKTQSKKATEKVKQTNKNSTTNNHNDNLSEEPLPNFETAPVNILLEPNLDQNYTPAIDTSGDNEITKESSNDGNISNNKDVILLQEPAKIDVENENLNKDEFKIDKNAVEDNLNIDNNVVPGLDQLENIEFKQETSNLSKDVKTISPQKSEDEDSHRNIEKNSVNNRITQQHETLTRDTSGIKRPSSVRPSSSRPGAPRLRDKHDTIITSADNLVGGRVNIIAEKTVHEEEDESTIVVIDDSIKNIQEEKGPLHLSSDEHGHLVQQILDAQKEFTEATGKTEIEWRFGAQKARDVVNQEIEQLRFNVQALSRVANPLGKLLDHIQEDVEVMRQELHQWIIVHKDASKELQKQKTANEEYLLPLYGRIKQLDVDIGEKHDKINDLKIVIHKNSSRIDKLLQNGNI